jgi:hypothetical protein
VASLHVLLASLNHSAVTAGRYLADVVRIGDVVYRRGDQSYTGERMLGGYTPFAWSAVIRGALTTVESLA